MFNTIFVQPLYAFFLFLYGVLKDPGVATILFSLAVRIPLSPLYWVLHKEEDRLRRIQQKMKERIKDKKNFAHQAEVISQIYEEENFKPMKNFILQLIPLPILLALIAVFRQISKNTKELLFFGTINLVSPNLFLAIATIFLQTIFIMTQPPETRKAGMFIIVIVALVVLAMPSIFTLYWITTTLWTLLERKTFHWYEIRFAVKPVNKDNT